MLFDLRGRGRRRAVQAIYLFLAILIGGGLILFGVGTGGGGGLLTPNNNSGNGTGAGNSYISQQAKNAQKQVRLHPNSPQAWANLVQAVIQDAGTGFNSTTHTYSAAGKADVQAADRDWQHYLKLAPHPDSSVALLVAEADQQSGFYAPAAQAWEIVADANPNVSSYWSYVAENAYSAKNTTLGDLAAAKAIALAPKTDRATLKSELNSIKSSATSSSSTSTTTPATTSSTVKVTPLPKAKKAKAAGKKTKGKK